MHNPSNYLFKFLQNTKLYYQCILFVVQDKKNDMKINAAINTFSVAVKTNLQNI